MTVLRTLKCARNSRNKPLPAQQRILPTLVATMAAAQAVGGLVVMPAITVQHQAICPILATELRNSTPARTQAALERLVVQEAHALSAVIEATLLLEIAIMAEALVEGIIIVVALLAGTVVVDIVVAAAVDIVEALAVVEITAVVAEVLAAASRRVATAAAANTNPAQITTARD